MEAVYSVPQGVPPCKADKPSGLWLSVEGPTDWREWCESENFGDIPNKVCGVVTLADSAKILRLRSPLAIRRFTDQYGCDPYMGPLAGRTRFYSYGIDWKRVAEKHDGIIIAPYQWSLRMDHDTNWYYTWDCASGCIWDASAVAGISYAEAL